MTMLCFTVINYRAIYFTQELCIDHFQSLKKTLKDPHLKRLRLQVKALPQLTIEVKPRHQIA